MDPAPTRHEEVRAVFESERGPLGRALLAWSGAPTVAEDSLAEAFAQLLRRGVDVRDPTAWVWTAAFRIAAGALKVRSATDRFPSGAATEGLSRWGDVTADRLDLLAAIGQLSGRQRRCVALVYIADLPATRAAELLATSPEVVRTQLGRARARLRELLNEEETP